MAKIAPPLTLSRFCNSSNSHVTKSANPMAYAMVKTGAEMTPFSLCAPNHRVGDSLAISTSFRHLLELSNLRCKSRVHCTWPEKRSQHFQHLHARGRMNATFLGWPGWGCGRCARGPRSSPRGAALCGGGTGNTSTLGRACDWWVCDVRGMKSRGEEGNSTQTGSFTHKMHKKYI